MFPVWSMGLLYPWLVAVFDPGRTAESYYLLWAESWGDFMRLAGLAFCQGATFWGCLLWLDRRTAGPRKWLWWLLVLAAPAVACPLAYFLVLRRRPSPNPESRREDE